MSPNETIHFLDKLSIRVVLLLSSLVLAIAFSFQLMYVFRDVLSFFERTGLPIIFVSLLPLCTYCLAHAAYYLTATFLIPRSINKTAVGVNRYSKNSVQKVHTLLDSLKDSSELSTSVREKIASQIKRMDGMIKKWDEGAAQDSKKAEQIKEGIEKWHAQNAHIYIVFLAVKFILIVVAIMAVRGLPTLQAATIIIIFLSVLHYPLVKAVFLLLKSLVWAVRRLALVYIRAHQMLWIVRRITLMARNEQIPFLLRVATNYLAKKYGKPTRGIKENATS